MLLKKLNTIYEDVVIGSLTNKKKSVNPAPMKAEANKSLTTQAPTYFKKNDEEAKKEGASEVPDEIVDKEVKPVPAQKLRKKYA